MNKLTANVRANVAIAATGDLSTAERHTVRNKLLEAFDEETTDIIMGYYDDAIASLEDAETVGEVTTIVEAFRTKVAALEAVNRLDNDVNLTVVYILTGAAVLLGLICVILAIVLLKKKGTPAPTSTVVTVTTVPDDGGNGGASAATEAEPDDVEEVVDAADDATDDEADSDEAAEDAEDSADDEAEEAEEAAEEAEESEEEKFDVIGENAEGAQAPADDTFAFAVHTKSKTFDERILETTEENQQVYSTLKNALCSYKKVKGRKSKKCESFRCGRELVAKISMVGKSVRMYIALDPTVYPVEKFHHKDMSAKKAYALVPMMVRVKGPRATKRALGLIDDCMSGKPKNSRYIPMDYVAQMKEEAANKSDDENK